MCIRDSNCGISNVNRKFDLSYSLFNVINHILKFEDLISFFKGIKSTLNKDGLYVFDCYNGIATILDNPRDRVKERHIGSDKIVIKTKCDYNDFEETLVLNNVVKYKKKNNWIFNQTQNMETWILKRYNELCWTWIDKNI